MHTICNNSHLCACSWGVPVPGGCLVPGGVPGPGGAWSVGLGLGLEGGACAPLGGGIPACTETPSANRSTNRCKNTTFATSLRTVNILLLDVSPLTSLSSCSERYLRARALKSITIQMNTRNVTTVKMMPNAIHNLFLKGGAR